MLGELILDMEIYVQKLPACESYRAIHRALAGAVRRVFGKRVEFRWRRFKKDNTKGALTFPTVQMGQRFLTHYPEGVSIRYRGRYTKATICQSRYPPDSRVVEGMIKVMEEMEYEPWSSGSEDDQIGPSALDYSSPRKDINYRRPGLHISRLEWGLWTTDGTFGRCGALERKGYLTHHSETGELEIVGICDIIDMLKGSGDENGITMDNVSIQEVLIGLTATGYRLFLTLSRIPRFWSQNPDRHLLDDIIDGTDDSTSARVFAHELSIFIGEELPIYRIPGLCVEHEADAPYCNVYVLNLEGPTLHRNLKRLLKSMRRHFPSDPYQYVKARKFSLVDELEKAARLYRNHDYRIAFQIESYMKNRLLVPSETEYLDPQIRILTAKHGIDLTIRILQNFATLLPIRTHETMSQGVEFSDMLRRAESILMSELQKPNMNIAWIHRLYITPAGYHMEGPEWMGSNRVLRLYPKHHHHFLKVSFVEENMSRIQSSREPDLRPILKGRWMSAFQESASCGIKVGGTKFQFLGFSSSSLKEHSAWFLAPFKHRGQNITADYLRSQLGDFSRIRCPPRLAARIGQTFTTTSHSIDLQTDDIRIKEIPDVEVREYNFSDGVGTISRLMIERIWRVSAVDDSGVNPVAYQIRLGGAKGVLSLDKTLRGDQICLRPSMIKFRAENSRLEIANVAKLMPTFLNRQIVVILETLGLPRDNFLTLQQTEVNHLERASYEFDEALRLCQQYGLGQASRLPSILKTLKIHGVDGVFQMPFFRRLNSLAIGHALKQIKYKTRVALDRSWKLMGVMDEFSYLKEGEIYVCLKDKTGNVEFLEGNTIVFRSPSLHCGDVQCVHAIGTVKYSNPLSSLYNCVVFSSQGSRPIPNMLSGGDLDGDLFDVSQNPLLFPPRWEPPDSYPSVAPNELYRECTMADIAEFFIDFIANDTLGQICTRHAIIADQSSDGVMNPKCVTLSRLASTAVDFPKTGHPVNIRSAPYVDSRVKPDFMARQPVAEEDYVPNPGMYSPQDISPNYYGTRPDRTYYYKSTKVLGEMYRSLDIQSLLKAWNAGLDWNEEGPEQLWHKIECNLQKLKPPYQEKWNDYLQQAKEAVEAYMDEFKIIQHTYNPTPCKREGLKETEVFLQCLHMDPSIRNIRGRGKSEYYQSFRDAYRSLVEGVRSEILGTMEGRFQRAAAYFHIGLESAKVRRRREGESFAWILVPDLFDAWDRVQKHGFIDGDESEEALPASPYGLIKEDSS